MKVSRMIFLALLLTAVAGIASGETIRTTNPGDTLEIDDFRIVLSPPVLAQYTDDDNQLFFIIATYHQDGSRAFGTASSLTKLYKKVWESGQTRSFENAGVPTTKADAELESQWISDGWTD